MLSRRRAFARKAVAVSFAASSPEVALYSWILFAHVLFVMLLAVGDVGSLLVAIRARRAGSARDILTLMRQHHFTVMCGIIPGAVGSLVTGAALVTIAQMSWTATWIAGAGVGWLASLLVGVGLLVPAEARAIREASRLVDSGVDAPTEELRRHVGHPRVWVGEWTTVLLLVAMTYLMVMKPQ